jgi:TRAP-type C4-dicarboxylate transport system substrate-binding protein
MKSIKASGYVAGFGLLFFTVIYPLSLAQASEVTKWRCLTAVSSASASWKGILRVAEKINSRTNGRLIIETHPVDAIMPSAEIFPAVKRNIIPMGMGWAQTWRSDIPAAVPKILPGAFKDHIEVIYFMKNVGYEQVMREDVYRHNVLWFPNHTSPQELVSKKPIRSLNDLKGMKVRSFGMLNQFFGEFGAAASWIAAPELYTALATGVVDGATYGAAIGAQALGLYEIAKFHIQPGFAAGAEGSWFINEAALKKLPEDIQDIVKQVMEEQFYERSVEHAIEERMVLANAQKKFGVEVITLSEEDQKIMLETAQKYWDEMAAFSPVSKKVIDMVRDYMKSLGRL